MGMGMRELLVILLVVLLVFGTKKMASIGSDLGRAVKGFKQAMTDGEHEESSGSPKQLGGKDADFPEAAAKKSETETKA